MTAQLSPSPHRDCDRQVTPLSFIILIITVLFQRRPENLRRDAGVTYLFHSYMAYAVLMCSY